MVHKFLKTIYFKRGKFIKLSWYGMLKTCKNHGNSHGQILSNMKNE
jgi:hypothetical protein